MTDLTPQEQILRQQLAQLGQALPLANNLGLTQDMQDIYYLIDFFTYLVDQTYPEIPCPTGCSHCCVDSGLPRVSSLEWQLIYTHILQLEEDVWQRILAQNEQFHRPQLPQFLEEQKRIAAPDTDLPLPQFGCKQCPFLLDGKCSIYSVRPAICRGFGYFTWRRGPEQESQVFACQMAADTLLEALQQRGSQQAVLPVWNRIADKIYDLEAEQGADIVATLPLWLLAHTTKVSEGDRLLPLDTSLADY